MSAGVHAGERPRWRVPVAGVGAWRQAMTILNSTGRLKMNKTVIGACATALATFLTSHAVNAEELIRAKLRACPTGTAIGKEGSCGKIWKLESGEARIDSNGRLHMKVVGLVLNDASTGQYNGTADGVTHVVGALLCAGRVAVQTNWSPLSNHGKAQIDVKLDIPQGCIAPTLVVREVWEGKVGGWLAAAGY